MMIDSLLQFDLASPVTVTAPSANIIDLGCSRDIGNGDDALPVVCTVVSTFTAAGSATLQVQLQTSLDANSWITLIETDVLAVATLTAGTEIFKAPLPLGVLRYLRLNYGVASGPMTAGAVTAEVVLDHQANTAYPSGFSAAN